METRNQSDTSLSWQKEAKDMLQKLQHEAAGDMQDEKSKALSGSVRRRSSQASLPSSDEDGSDDAEHKTPSTRKPVRRTSSKSDLGTQAHAGLGMCS